MLQDLKEIFFPTSVTISDKNRTISEYSMNTINLLFENYDFETIGLSSNLLDYQRADGYTFYDSIM